MHSAVFLDRDNTLIDNSGDLGDPALVRLLPGVARGVQALHAAGYALIVITNQGGVARGKYTEDDVDAVNRRLAELLGGDHGQNDDWSPDILRFYSCPYHPEGKVEEYRREHSWRKPQPGMLLQAARDLDLDLAASWMVGDQVRDIEAGRAAGCRTVLITDQKAGMEKAHPTAVVESFREAVRHILSPAQSRDIHHRDRIIPLTPES